MRKIAVLKDCLPAEKALLLSAAENDDELYFSSQWNEEEIDIVFGEPDADAIHAMKRLRWIQMSWAGANKYTSMESFPAGITLTSASGAFGPVISEHVLAGILSLYKNLPRYRDEMQAGNWQLLFGDEALEGKTALILGAGNIGQETAKRLKAFGVYTISIRRTPGEKPPCFDEIYTVDALDALLNRADMVIVTLPGTEQTRGLINKERLQKMKTGAIFANVGRGFVVDTQALTSVLETGALRGAVLDVTDPEPLPENHPLRKLNNVILTPHVSGISWGENLTTRKRILDIFCENLRRDAQGLPLKNTINFETGY